MQSHLFFSPADGHNHWMFWGICNYNFANMAASTHVGEGFGNVSEGELCDRMDWPDMALIV